MEIKINDNDFRKEISDRGIQHLIHFTPTINLLSIYEQGRLLSRALLEKNDIDDNLLDFIEFLDDVRFDDKNYINLSLSSPNHFLFRRFIERTKDKPYVNWCVLKISPKYIYKKDTIFSVTNAASSIAKYTYGISGDIKKFKKIFENGIISKVGNLQRGSLKSKYPTDVQAEVLVRDEIDLADILQVCFQNESDLAKGKAALSGYNTKNFSIDTTMFTNLRL